MSRKEITHQPPDSSFWQQKSNFIPKIHNTVTKLSENAPVRVVRKQQIVKFLQH